MARYENPITVLEETVHKHPSLPVLKIPNPTPTNGSGAQTWSNVTYSQFMSDLEKVARYYTHEFSKKGFKEHSVVGLWLKGTAYRDLVQIWGIARAGFIPQLFSLRMSHPEVVYQLLKEAGAVALIYEPSFEHLLVGDSTPGYSAGIDIASLDVDHLPLPDVWKPTEEDQFIMIFHTSGSTSGIPKLVPMTAKWLDHQIKVLSNFVPYNPEKPQVSVASGSFCHGGNSIMLMIYSKQAACYLLPTKVPYEASELRAMVENEGLRALNLFGPALTKFIQAARQDASLLALLQSLDSIGFGGAPIDDADETWLRAQGVLLSNGFGSTEAGMVLHGMGRNEKEARYLRPVPGIDFEMLPTEETTESGERLLELVIPDGSASFPYKTFRNPETGKFHTNDLFVEIEPKAYLYKGRNDDFIKMELALKCDTRVIENNVMETCGHDLVSAVVVVGAGRPSPAMVVEPKDETVLESEDKVAKLREEIVRRIKPFHERRYVHERIDDARFVLVVPGDTLPRTASKGNLQRKHAEKQFVDLLDRVYST